MECDESWSRQLIINIMRFLFERGDHEEAAHLRTRMRQHFTETLGPTHPQTVEVSRLGLHLWAIGRYREAAELKPAHSRVATPGVGEENEERSRSNGTS